MDQRVILTPFLQVYTDTRRLNQDSSYAVLGLHSTNKVTNQHYILKRGLILLWGGEWTHDERKNVEEYWWAITQAAGRSVCYRSGSSWLDFGSKM